MKTILIIDDEETIRESMKAALGELGAEFNIIEADNGLAGLHLAETSKPDLIISDVVMDNGNGFLLRELLKSNRMTSSIPVVLMTGFAQDKGAWGSDSGVEYLEKPFAAQTLLTVVKKFFP